MTTPVIPASVLGDEQPGVGDRIGSAIAPFMAMLQAKQMQHERYQQLLLQRGKLAVEQEAQDLEKTKFNEKQKSLKELSEQIGMQLSKVQSPEDFQAAFGGIMQKAAVADLVTETSGALEKFQTMDAEQTTRKSVRDIHVQYQGKTDRDSLMAKNAELMSADPTHAGSYSNVFMTLYGQGGSSSFHLDTHLIDGKAKRVIVRPDGSVQPIGDAMPIARENRPVMGEREKASAAVMAIPVQERLRKADLIDPDIANRVYTKVAQAYGAGGFISRLTGKQDPRVIEAAVEKTMTDDERTYYSDAKALLSAMIPALAGKVVTGNELVTHGGPLFSTGSGDKTVIANKSANRDARIRNSIGEAGDAFTDRVGELQDVDLSRYMTGGKPGKKPTSPFSDHNW